MDAFEPAWWLPGPHLQTVWGRISRPRRLVDLRREVLETPDGDELVLDHLGSRGETDRHVVLLHGLEGSSYSVYIQGLLSVLASRGVEATVLNFRSCARDPARPMVAIPNRRPRLYHSGETTDLDLVLRTLSARYPERRFGAIGVSLGGNVLLKWLGEHRGQTILRAAATASVPYDLDAGARHLDSPLGRLYVGTFLRSLARKAADTAARFEEARPLIDVVRARRARTFHEFDDAATAPLHGFAGALDYYERSSAIRWLDRIDTPVYCLSASDDPFVPPTVLAQVKDLRSDAVTIETTDAGGHIGFIGGRAPWRPHYWAEMRLVERVLDYLA